MDINLGIWGQCKSPCHLNYGLLSDSSGIQTHNLLVLKRALNHLAKLAKWFSVCLRTKWLWVRIPLLSLKLQICCLLRARHSLTLRQTIKCRFTQKFARDMIITYSYGLLNKQFINHACEF